MKLTVRKTMAIFAGIGIADAAIGILRYPGIAGSYLGQIFSAFLGINFNAVADGVQIMLGIVSMAGFIATPLAFQDDKATATAAETPK